MEKEIVGEIIRISGPVVQAKNMRGARLYDVARIGEMGLIGEIIEVNKDIATIQCYEITDGIRPGEKVVGTGEPLSVMLGPGIMSQIYDGIQRPLPAIKEQTGAFINRGVETLALDIKKKWDYNIIAKKGDTVVGGDIIATVQETPAFEHRIMIPPKISGKIVEIKPSGSYTIEEVLAVVEDEKKKKHNVLGYQLWPVRIARPFRGRFPSTEPLVTGQRIFDTFFPIAKGGVAAIPGPFGTGKCLTGDTPVLLANGELIAIKDLYYKLSNNGILEESNDFESIIKLHKPLQVIGFDKSNGNQKIVDATSIYHHIYSPVMEIETRKGRKVRLTPAHKLQIFDGINIVEKQAKDIEIDDFMVMPRSISIPGHNDNINIYDIDLNLRAVNDDAILKMNDAIQIATSKYGTLKKVAEILSVSYSVIREITSGRNNPTLRFLKKLSELTEIEIPVTEVKAERQSSPVTFPKEVNQDLAEFLGLLLSDGQLKGSRSVYFFNNDEVLRNRFSELAGRLFNITCNESFENTVYAVKFHSVPIRRFLENLGIPTLQKSRNATIPNIIMKSKNEVIASFLNGYIAGDGSVYNYTLEISTSSKAMNQGISYILSRLGIVYRVSTRITKDHPRHRISVEGKELVLLYEWLSEQYEYPKTLKIQQYINKDKKHFVGTDVIPLSSELLQKIGRSAFTKNSSITNYDNVVYNNQNLTTTSLNELLNDLESIESFEVHQLEFIGSLLQEYYFDRIKSINFLESKEEVFDLVVPTTNTFIGGQSPMILHNTVTQHALAKFSDAQIVVYVGCGERGNEMTDVLEVFPELEDPRSGLKLMARTTMIANTSNMPVAAREASVYTGITMAEYFRDQGYDVAMMADSTSRWAEAMREISGRLEEMPGEAGYPAYLASKIAAYYERGGRVELIGTETGRTGSISIIGAVSPPGGDFSEPVTQQTLRVVKAFWALTKKLAEQRHFPAISYLDSYTLYWDILKDYYGEHFSKDFDSMRTRAFRLLQEDNDLQEIVQLVGPDALPPAERITLEAARILKEDYLQQNAFHKVDAFCSPEKQSWMLRNIFDVYDKMKQLYSAGVELADILEKEIFDRIPRMKYTEDIEDLKKLNEDIQELNTSMFKIIQI
jgi:V/A-type H+/Na+-transporting ATPase subunit A